MSHKYRRLLARTFSISTSTMLMYRANILFFLVFEMFFLAGQFATVAVGFRFAGPTIAGWTRDQAFLLTAVNGVSHQLFICFFINSIFSLGQQVWNGQFDYVLLKPLHPLAGIFFTSQFMISNLPNTALNLVVVGYLLVAGGLTPSLIGCCWFVTLILLGLAVRIALALLCTSPVFYSERLAEVEDSFWSVASFGRYPLQIFPRPLALTLRFVLPLGLMASLPTETLLGRGAWGELLGSITAGVLFVAVSVVIFLRSVRRYQSVNSGI